MANAVNILDQGFACLVDNLGVIDAEYFISLIKRDYFDYTVWQVAVLITDIQCSVVFHKLFNCHLLLY